MRDSSSSARLLGEEEGSVTILSLAVAVIVVMLVLITISISAVYLEKKRLQNFADELACEAVSAVDDYEYYAGGSTDSGALPVADIDSVRQLVYAGYRRAGEEELKGLEEVAIVRVSKPTPKKVSVEVSGIAKIPFSAGLLETFLPGIQTQAVATCEPWNRL